MKLSALTLALAAALLGACASTPLAGKLSPSAARQQAQADFAAGRPMIYSAGGIALFDPGIAPGDRALVAKLPRNGRLAGCTNPQVRYSVDYATAYNQEMIALLRKSRAR
jgi:hypothetical protein